MKHSISIAVAALAVVVAGCNARPGSAANKVTVAGCVQSAEQGLGASDQKDIDKFMLTNVALGSPAPATAPAPPPAPNDPARSDQARNDAAAPPAVAPTTTDAPYLLDGKTSELREHLNHQVEITGRLDEAKDLSSPTIGRRPELHVDSLRMIAATCNP